MIPPDHTATKRLHLQLNLPHTPGPSSEAGAPHAKQCSSPRATCASHCVLQICSDTHVASAAAQLERGFLDDGAVLLTLLVR